MELRPSTSTSVAESTIQHEPIEASSEAAAHEDCAAFMWHRMLHEMCIL